MELFTYLMAKNDHNISVNKDLFSYLLGKNQSGTYTDYSGTSLSINNTKKGKMKVNLLGNTSQTGTPTPSTPIDVNVVSGDNDVVVCGKNILENTITTQTLKGINYTKNQDGSITMSGTSTSADSVYGIFTTPLILKKDKSYIFSIGNKTTDFGIYLQNGANNNVYYIGTSSTATSTSFTPQEDTKIDRLAIHVPSGKTVNGTIYPMLEVGSTATTYEPYTSTSYPIHLGGELFDYAYQVEKQYNSSGTQQSSQRYTLSNNVITISRDKSNYGRYFMNKKQLIAGDYTLKFTPTLSGSDNRISFSIMDLDTQVEYDEETITITNGTEITKTFTLDTSANISINIQPYKDTSGTLTFTNVSLKSTMEEYELCKIGDYKDKFFKNIPNTTDYKSDLEDNEWYLEKKIGKVVLDGNNSSLASGGTSTSGYNRWRVTLDKPKPTSSTSEIAQIFSDKLIGVSAGNTWNRIQGISIDTSNNYSFFYIEEVATYTLNNFKTWLTNNPITLYYQYSSPTYTPITGTLKDELEALQKAQSYKGTTNINQINNDLPFNMNVSVKVGN